MSKLTSKIYRLILLRIIGRRQALDIVLDDIERKLLSFKRKGYLKEVGWFETFNNKSPVDENGLPIPWVTYSFIDFIENKLPNHITVFEYGSGNSTLFYSKKVKHVTSVEHDQAWFEQMSKAAPDNAEIIYETLEYGGDYSKKALEVQRKFGLIIVDGRDRVNCCLNAIEALTPEGVIVLDDSERKQYQPAIEFLEKNNFKQIQFWGIAPGIFFNKCTSLFYRDKNFLNL